MNIVRLCTCVLVYLKSFTCKLTTIFLWVEMFTIRKMKLQFTNEMSFKVFVCWFQLSAECKSIAVSYDYSNWFFQIPCIDSYVSFIKLFVWVCVAYLKPIELEHAFVWTLLAKWQATEFNINTWNTWKFCGQHINLKIIYTNSYLVCEYCFDEKR